MLAQPIEKLPCWKNPIPVYEADKITNCFVGHKKKLRMLERLLPKLNDDNDPPSYNRYHRASGYLRLAQLYLETGDLKNSKKSAEMGRKIVIDQEYKDALDRLLDKVNRNQRQEVNND